MRTHDDATAMLRAWRAQDLGQRALREAFLGLLEARPDATKRSCVPGHITASAVVLSADLSRTLLTLHPRVKRWVQLGGHCEKKDATIAARLESPSYAAPDFVGRSARSGRAV